MRDDSAPASLDPRIAVARARRVLAILRAAGAYAGRETDLRGHTGATGWAHAAAHTVDLLARLAQLPAFTDADRAQILDAMASFVVRRRGQILAYGEDGRLATSPWAGAG